MTREPTDAELLAEAVVDKERLIYHLLRVLNDGLTIDAVEGAERCLRDLGYAPGMPRALNMLALGEPRPFR